MAEHPERFKNTARKLGVDETAVSFERLFETIVSCLRKKPCLALE